MVLYGRRTAVEDLAVYMSYENGDQDRLIRGIKMYIKKVYGYI